MPHCISTIKWKKNKKTGVNKHTLNTQTKDKVFNIVLRRTKGKNCQQFVQCDPCCHTLQTASKVSGSGSAQLDLASRFSSIPPLNLEHKLSLAWILNHLTDSELTYNI